MKAKLILKRGVANYNQLQKYGFVDGQIVNVDFMGKNFGNGNYYRLSGVKLDFYMEANIDFMPLNNK